MYVLPITITLSWLPGRRANQRRRSERQRARLRAQTHIINITISSISMIDMISNSSSISSSSSSCSSSSINARTCRWIHTQKAPNGPLP